MIICDPDGRGLTRLCSGMRSAAAPPPVPSSHASSAALRMSSFRNEAVTHANVPILQSSRQAVAFMTQYLGLA
jgi:hypothetical protein